MGFFDDCIAALVELKHDNEYKKFINVYNDHKKIIVIGNGGSNAAAAHIAQDFTKLGGKQGLTFSDPSMLTCFMNDYGVDEAYKKYLESFADNETLVILISSSGNSKNILNCVKYCSEKKISYGVLTAFMANNPVRMTASSARFNYYVDTMSYGVAECVHQIFLHGAVG
jgi:D-sedoheptulose 7-phosphate isomerase